MKYDRVVRVTTPAGQAMYIPAPSFRAMMQIIAGADAAGNAWQLLTPYSGDADVLLRKAREIGPEVAA